MDISTFIKTEADNIWTPGTKHYAESLQRVSRFCNFSGYGDRQLDDFKARDIRAFLQHLVSDGLSTSSANRYAAAVSSVFKHAVHEEFITRAPQVRYEKEPEGRPRFFTDAEQERLVAFLRRSRAPWMADMAILSLQTGMRHGEILKIGTEHSELIKGGSMPVLRLHKTKNGDARDIPLNEVAKAAYDALSAGNWYSHRVFYNVWDEARYTIARGDKDFVFHVCRHTAATKMANDLNINTTLIGKFLGHRSSETTKKYIKLTDDSSMEIAERMCRG